MYWKNQNTTSNKWRIWKNEINVLRLSKDVSINWQCFSTCRVHFDKFICSVGTHCPYGTCHGNVIQYVKERYLFYGWINSGPGVFCEKSVLNNFEKLTQKHLYQNRFNHPTLSKQRLWQRQRNSSESYQIFRNIFFTLYLLATASENIKFLEVNNDKHKIGVTDIVLVRALLDLNTINTSLYYPIPN